MRALKCLSLRPQGARIARYCAAARRRDDLAGSNARWEVRHHLPSGAAAWSILSTGLQKNGGRRAQGI